MSAPTPPPWAPPALGRGGSQGLQSPLSHSSCQLKSSPPGRENGRPDTPRTFLCWRLRDGKAPRPAMQAFASAFFSCLGWGSVGETAPENSSPLARGLMPPGGGSGVSVLGGVCVPPQQCRHTFWCACAGVMFVTGTETRFSQLSIPCKPSTAKLIKRRCDFRMFVSATTPSLSICVS